MSLYYAKVTCPVCEEVRKVTMERYKIAKGGWAKHPYDIRMCNSCSHRGSTKKKRAGKRWNDTTNPSDVLNSQVKILTREEIDAIAHTITIPTGEKKAVLLPDFHRQKARF